MDHAGQERLRPDVPMLAEEHLQRAPAPREFPIFSEDLASVQECILRELRVEHLQHRRQPQLARADLREDDRLVANRQARQHRLQERLLPLLGVKADPRRDLASPRLVRLLVRLVLELRRRDELRAVSAFRLVVVAARLGRLLPQPERVLLAQAQRFHLRVEQVEVLVLRFRLRVHACVRSIAHARSIDDHRVDLDLEQAVDERLRGAAERPADRATGLALLARGLDDLGARLRLEVRPIELRDLRDLLGRHRCLSSDLGAR